MKIYYSLATRLNESASYVEIEEVNIKAIRQAIFNKLINDPIDPFPVKVGDDLYSFKNPSQLMLLFSGRVLDHETLQSNLKYVTTDNDDDRIYVVVNFHLNKSQVESAILEMLNSELTQINPNFQKINEIVNWAKQNEIKYTDPKWRKTAAPNLLYQFGNFEEANFDDPYFEKLLQLLADEQFSVKDEVFGNNPFLYAISKNNNLARKYFDFIRVHQQYRDLLTVRNDSVKILENGTKVNRDHENTPLLLAIKEGNDKLAVDLLPYYQVEDLLKMTTSGNNALHLACYAKMDRLIEAILGRAEELKIKNDLLNTQNKMEKTPWELYLRFPLQIDHLIRFKSIA